MKVKEFRGHELHVTLLPILYWVFELKSANSDKNINTAEFLQKGVCHMGQVVVWIIHLFILILLL